MVVPVRRLFRQLKSWLDPANVYRRRVQRTPLGRIADLHDGQYVRIVGQARGEDGPRPLPLSGGHAATFTLRVRRVVYNSQGPDEATLLDDVDCATSLWIDDGTGLARVERRGWSRLVGAKKTEFGRLPHELHGFSFENTTEEPPEQNLRRYYGHFWPGGPGLVSRLRSPIPLRGARSARRCGGPGRRSSATVG